MINNLQDLKELVDELLIKFDGFDLTKVNIALSDRFNEFKLSGGYAIYEGIVTLSCEQVGNVFKGTHRVLGKD